MAKNSMPVSKARTAYGLLSEIRKLILEEPKRYDQMNVFQRVGTHSDLAPACGTVCCVGGWTAVLKAPRTRDAFRLDRAEQILGLDGRQASELFYYGAAGRRGSDLPGHAERGAAHIAAFQQKYSKQLKAKKV